MTKTNAAQKSNSLVHVDLWMQNFSHAFLKFCSWMSDLLTKLSNTNPLGILI